MDEKYPWREPYRNAVAETDISRKPHLIYEAIASIEQRLLNPVEPSSDEEMALKEAQAGVVYLKAIYLKGSMGTSDV